MTRKPGKRRGGESRESAVFRKHLAKADREERLFRQAFFEAVGMKGTETCRFCDAPAEGAFMIPIPAELASRMSGDPPNCLAIPICECHGAELDSDPAWKESVIEEAIKTFKDVLEATEP
jgi:hypothetical protein